MYCTQYSVVLHSLCNSSQPYEITLLTAIHLGPQTTQTGDVIPVDSPQAAGDNHHWGDDNGALKCSRDLQVLSVAHSKRCAPPPPPPPPPPHVVLPPKSSSITLDPLMTLNGAFVLSYWQGPHDLPPTVDGSEIVMRDTFPNRNIKTENTNLFFTASLGSRRFLFSSSDVADDLCRHFHFIQSTKRLLVKQ